MTTNNEPAAPATPTDADADAQARMVEILRQIEAEAPGAIQRMRTAFAAGLPGIERFEA